MARVILTRLLNAVLAIWGVVTIVFVAARLLGDPVLLMLPIGASDADVATLRASLGLDQSLGAQYVDFLRRVAVGDFGTSFQFQRPAMTVVLERLPDTMMLAMVALVLAVAFGLVGGFLAARFRGTLIEFVTMLVALIGQATPVFWLGLVFILIFAVQLRWLPTGGTGGVEHIILPALTLATFTSASVARLFRSSLIEVLSQDYIRTARAKGVSTLRLFLKHATPNAAMPVLTMVGILAGELLGGAVITETIFSWPGVGRVIVQAIETKDFSVVQAGAVVLAAIFIAVNLIVDLLYVTLDPRLRA
ncbi:ABC transporter permease [Microvirga antarctica]|uniref:ABC transporter permease n=1 Tax=Microvirga antarctica TaxID=2819233 RepID=UPI001B30A81F|nr:ABC transporter permease [Microvirga antarctica]